MFPDIEILEIHLKINKEPSQLYSNIRIEMVNTEKQKHSNRVETQTNRNGNITHTIHGTNTKSRRNINVQTINEMI